MFMNFFEVMMNILVSTKAVLDFDDYFLINVKKDRSFMILFDN